MITYMIIPHFISTVMTVTLLTYHIPTPLRQGFSGQALLTGRAGFGRAKHLHISTLAH
jgi:hypothetical protein